MLAQAAQTTASTGRAASDVADKPHWTDVAGFWVALAAAVITLAAVLVALWSSLRRSGV